MKRVPCVHVTNFVQSEMGGGSVDIHEIINDLEEDGKQKEILYNITNSWTIKTFTNMYT